MEINKIKEDLRQLRFLSHFIEAKLTMKARHEKRLEILETLPPGKDVDREKEKVRGLLASCQIEDSIKKASELEQKYIVAIEKLDYIERTIIIDGYINGKPYWRIGRDIGYTTEGIQKRAKRAVEELSKLI
ncbi:MAG: hypothetical protein IJ033_03800 [Clostridia bacterium]|nr:hypothetical protein [Clostridia bacterium]